MEAEEILRKHEIAISHFQFQHNEIRADGLEEIAIEAARAAYAKLRKPVIVEDSGLFIPVLNGFPSTYSAWAMGKIGCDGILKLMRNEKNRNAYFEACIVFVGKKPVKTFTARCKGKVAMKKAGNSGFGYDPIFIPDGYDKTFGQSISLKNKLSHRYKSLLKFIRYYKLKVKSD